MLSYALLITALLGNGQVVHSPTFFYDTKAECEFRGQRAAKPFVPNIKVNHQLPIVSVKYQCLTVVPEQTTTE